MSGMQPIPDPLDKTVADVTPGAPMPLSLDATLADPFQAGAPTDFPTLPDSAVGSFTTTLAASASASRKMNIAIPAPFLAAGTTGAQLRLVPVEVLRGKPVLEIYLKTGDIFTLGRSPEADWITAFFPRSEKNDLRSRRLSKLHACVAFRDGQLRAHRFGSGALHVGANEVGPDPAYATLRERDRIVLAEDYALEVSYDISLQGTLQFVNGEAWRTGRIDFGAGVLGAVRFQPLNSQPAIRTSCWLFVDVGFGSARGGVLTVGSELAPQQGVFLALGGCFWILNLVGNEKVSVNGHTLAGMEAVPLSRSDSVWLGAARYRAEIV